MLHRRLGRLLPQTILAGASRSSLAFRASASQACRFSTSANVIVKAPVEMPELKSDVVKLPLPTFIMSEFLKPERKDQVAIMDGMSGSSLTFGEAFYAACSLANSLEKAGVKKGDRIALISPNHLHFFTVFMGISLSQAISTCMNPLCSDKEMAFQIEKTNARLVFTHPMCLETVRKVFPDDRIIVIDSPSAPAQTDLRRLSSMISLAPFEGAEKRLRIPDDFDPQALLTIPFSSGTTGRSKGVMLTHSNLVNNVLQILPYEGNYLRPTATKPRGTLLVPLPFFHIYGLVAALLLSSYTGAKLVFMPAFDLKRFLELIVSERVTRAFVVPPIVLALAKHPMIAQYDLSSVECFMSGAAPLGEEIQVAAAKRLGCLVKQAWGMTETSPCGTITPDHMVKSVESLKGTSGLLAPGTEGKIIDPLTGKDLAPHETGELLVRGPQVMKGYLDDIEATKACLTPDGWLHTGDIGHFDSEGWLYITDRLKELIKYKGLQVPPAELEAVLNSMPALKDAIVIPVPDEEAGELPRAYVVKQEGAQVTEEEVLQYVAERVAPYKRLRGGVRFTDAVPKSPSGKLLRRMMIDIDRANR